MRKRMFYGFALLAALSVIITSMLVTAVAYRGFQSAIRREIAAEASYLSDAFSLYGDDYLKRIDLRPGHRITVIAPDGAVSFDSKTDPAQMENHADRPEFQNALRVGMGEATRVSDTLRESTYYHALRLADGSVFRMAGATDSLLAAYDDLFWLVIVTVIGVCLLAALAASILTRRLVKPLNTINLDTPEQATSYEEIAPLLTRIHKQRRQIGAQTQELEQQRAHFAAITENMNEGLLILDRDGNLLSHNKSALRLLGSFVPQPIGMHIFSLNRSAQFRDAVQTAMQGESDAQIVSLGGRHCQLFVSPVNDEGAKLGIIVILMDVTERYEREKLRREFTANVSHELKTPLTAISGYAELMMNQVAKAADIPAFSKSIYEESQRLISLVRDLMFLSRLEEGLAPPFERTDLRSAAESTVAALSAKAASCSIGIELHGESAEILAIPSVLQELLYNLIDNAIKYNRAGGHVDITIEPQESVVYITVSDTGTGIPKEEQGRVFERFYRMDKSHNKRIEGTGLGLAIVKHGAALHKADITLKSSDSGTSFTLRFARVDE